MTSRINILIIEDNESYRDVLRLAIQKDREFNILAEFGTAEVALSRMASLGLQPDLILLDLNLPNMNGLDAIKVLLTISPKSKILILSQSNAEHNITRAITEGASGYLFKSSGVDEIRKAIKNMVNGVSTIDPTVATYVLGLIKQAETNENYRPFLTERELSVLKLLAEGLVKKEIADRLSISYGTVDSHVRHIFEKLDARNAASAVSIGHRLGLIH